LSMPCGVPVVLRSWFRACLVIALASAFGFRIVAMPTASACMSGGASASAAGHSGHHEHRPPGSPAPRCECIAHASGTGFAVEAPRLGPALPPQVEPARAVAPQPAAPVASVAHVLPFSIGPPALLA
jgi:hypothetical protein